MAMLAPKSPYPAQMGSGSLQQSAGTGSTNVSSRRVLHAMPINTQNFASPTESEFSESTDDPDSARHWDEERVCDWLHTVNCGPYEKIFRRNNINGENLLEMDKDVLKEMGVDKIGDRVRLFIGIKKLRTKAYANQKKRNRNSFAPLEMNPVTYTPSSNGSPRPPPRSVPTSAVNKRHSRQIDGFNYAAAVPDSLAKTSSRPNSPLPGAEARAVRQQRYGVMSPVEVARREQAQGYFVGGSNPGSAASSSGRNPGTPQDLQGPQTARLISHHTRANGSIDGSLMASLPQDQDVIRVISTGGVTKVVKITDCQSCDEVMRVTLRKFGYREDHDRNYCFYTLGSGEPDAAAARRLHEPELWRIVKDQKRPERNRLILRKIHAGEPGEAELQRAADIAIEETASAHARAMETAGKRSQVKISHVLGEPRDNGLQYPLSPASFRSGDSTVSASERERNVHNAAKDLERPQPFDTARPRKKTSIRQFFGGRPPSELITQDLRTFFPDQPKEQIDKTVRLSMRRSQRLSRANSRLSIVSTISFGSSISDAPPIPRIEASWLQGNQLAKVRTGERASSVYRDSVASSMLDAVQEESPIEPNRKSYVSFDSGSDTAPVSVTDPDGNTVRHSYFDEGSTKSGSLKEITQALNEDGEGPDEELQSFLAGDSWDDNKWMKGALIGQGSFGSVYIALHAITGELLAVKQVETPSVGASSANDARKKSMVDALKREISLLRDLQHPNIVQYLGCSSSAEHLNIFLEYVPGGSVQSMLNSYGPLQETLVRSFVRQILVGLEFLHARDIIHRDIKGANILVDNKGGIKISDFGISKKIEASNLLSAGANHKNRPSLQGSVFWMAPEVVKQTSYTRKADIWSLGCLIVEMMTGNHPYPDCSQLQAIFKIGGAKASPTIPETASDEAKAFLAQTFMLDHTKRPDATDLLHDPFLNAMA